MKNGVEIRGLEALQALLKSAPVEIAIPAGKKGVTMASARMRTYLRRAAPRGDTGKLKAAIRSKVMKGRKSATAYAGLKKILGEAKARNYYATLEKGRKPYTRNGRAVKGSPNMKRFAFFFQTVAAHKAEVLQLQVDATRAELMKRLGSALTRAALKGRR